MKPGDVVLTPIPQADGAIKNRPALILCQMPAYRDLLVCGISTQLHQEMKGFDELISSSDPDFTASGLKSNSLIRLSFLAVLPRRDVVGSIGSISPERPAVTQDAKGLSDQVELDERCEGRRHCRTASSSDRMPALKRMAAFNSFGLRRLDAAFESAVDVAHFKGLRAKQ